MGWASLAEVLARRGEYTPALAALRDGFNNMEATGERWQYGRIPSLEESIAQGAWHVGTADEIGEQLFALQADLGLEYLTIFPHFPGMVREQAIEQLERFASDIRPRLLNAPVAASA